MKRLRILGIRGIPARHGGFETFAEQLALHLVGRGWEVTVYCQESGEGPFRESRWRGVHLVHCPVRQSGALATVAFDWKSVRHAADAGELVLTLGYNTACFCTLYRLRGVPNVINMDGLEWKRLKWSWPERAWLYLNEWCGCRLGSHLVADHPQIEAHLHRRTGADRVTMIPYGAERASAAEAGTLEPLGLAPRGYALVIARPEPENSILEMVRAFARRRRGCRLVVLGVFEPERSDYQRRVLEAASDEVLFPGAIYDGRLVGALRFHNRIYLHGHTVGGTNPSLVEALGAGSPVLARDNAFNRWVAGPEAAYFRNESECERLLDELLDDRERLDRMAAASAERFASRFTWDRVLGEYEQLLERWVLAPRSRPV